MLDSAEPSISEASRRPRSVGGGGSRFVKDWGYERCFSRALAGDVQMCECDAVTVPSAMQLMKKSEDEQRRKQPGAVTRKIRTKQRVVSECLSLFLFFIASNHADSWRDIALLGGRKKKKQLTS